MADRDIISSTEYLQFTQAETQTIEIDDDYHANVMFLDMSAPVTHTVDIKNGATQVFKGYIGPVVTSLRFGNGCGSGEDGDNITVETDGAAEIFVGIKQFRNTNPQ